MPGIDSNALLVAHGNGNLLDSSQYAATNTNNGATTANSVNPFGSGGSIHFTAASNQYTAWAVTAPSGTNPYTYEMFLNFDSLPSNGSQFYFLSSMTSAGGGVLYGINNNSGTYRLLIYHYNGGSATVNIAQNITTPSTGSWYGFSVSNDGTNVRVFWGPAGGTASLVNTTANGTIGAQANGLTIGTWYRDSGVVGTYYLDGYVSEIRYSNISRYNASYTLQTAPFSSSTATFSNFLMMGV